MNGRAVGNGFGDEARLYALPPKLLKAGDNLVVVNVHDFWGNGGLHGPADQRALLFADGTRVPLTDWEYSVAPSGLWPPHAPWESLSGVNVLYNAMIAPLGKYGLRGVAWYQGEANAGLDDARRYQALLAAWMADWRRQFDAPLPFLIVQLANFGKLATTPVDSGWAQLRDAQRRAVAADGNAATRGHHRHRQSRRHPSGEQAGRGPAAGARGAPRGLWREDLGVRRAAGDRDARRWRGRGHAG